MLSEFKKLFFPLFFFIADVAFAQSPVPTSAPVNTANPATGMVGAPRGNTIVKDPVFEIVTLDFPPLESEGPDGAPVGAAVDVVREVFKHLDMSINIRVYPWTRSLQLVREGKADAIFTAYRKPDREEYLDYTSEILINQVVSLYVKADSKRKFKGDLRELKGASIGVVSTISYGEKFDRAVEKYKLTLERVNEFQQNLKKLVSGRIDFLVSNSYTAAVELERLGLQSEIKEMPVPVEVTPSYLAFSKAKSHKMLVPKFDEALRKVKASGKYAEILARFKVVPPTDSKP